MKNKTRTDETSRNINVDMVKRAIASMQKSGAKGLSEEDIEKEIKAARKSIKKRSGK